MDEHEFCGTACDFCHEQIADGAPIHHGWTKGVRETLARDEQPAREMQWCDQCNRWGASDRMHHVGLDTHRCACQPCQSARLLRDLRASVQVSL